MNKTEAILALEDGRCFRGSLFGATGEVEGEIVFNTSMSGYQEVLTDPSYCGQMVVMTYPLIGNYGINPEDFESDRPYLSGFIIKELSGVPSNWRSQETLDAFLKRYGVVGIQGLDTRALTRHIRDKGAQRAILSNDVSNPKALIEKVRGAVNSVNSRKHSGVSRRNEEGQRHYQICRVQEIAAIILHEGTSLFVPTLGHDLLVDTIHGFLPSISVSRERALISQSQSPIDGNPGHQFGVDVVLLSAANFPYTFVLPLPVSTNPVD